MLYPLLAAILLTVHVDVAFTPHERFLIATAGALLTRETAGIVTVRTAEDLDFRDIRMVQRIVREPSIMRIEIWDPKITEVDEYFDTHAVAWTSRPRIYLVPERIVESSYGKDPDLVFVHVVMHEMLHDIGVSHVPDPSSIMFVNASPTMWLTPWDWAALLAIDKPRELRILGP